MFAKFDALKFLRETGATPPKVPKVPKVGGPGAETLGALGTLGGVEAQTSCFEGDAEKATLFSPSLPTDGPRNRLHDVGEPEGRTITVAAVEVPPGVPGAWCQGIAKLLLKPAPRGWTDERWRMLRDDACRFIREHGAEAARFGWTELDIFSCHPEVPLARHDCAGLVLLIQGCTVVEIDETSAAIEDAKGRRLTYRRHPAPGERVPVWELEN